MPLRFVPLGVGDAFSEHNYSCCVAVLSRDKFILVDCPHPILKMLREAREATGLPLTPDRLHGVVLTHLHADHASGLESLAYHAFFVLRRRLRVATHPDVEARLWDGHLAAGMEQMLPAVGQPFVKRKLDDYIDLTRLSEESAVRFGPFDVECRKTIHHIPTTAVRLRGGDGSLGLSADTAFDEGLIAWLTEADLAIHETNFGIHTPYQELAALPEATRARMRLIHYPDGFDKAGSAIAALEERKAYEAG